MLMAYHVDYLKEAAMVFENYFLIPENLLRSSQKLYNFMYHVFFVEVWKVSVYNVYLYPNTKKLLLFTLKFIVDKKIGII